MKSIQSMFKLFILLFMAIPLLLSAATTSVTNSTSGAINDKTCFNKTFNVNIGSTIVDNVTISVELDHTYRGDLDITLSSPAGTQIELTTDNGGDYDNLYTNFDDNAADSITSYDQSQNLPLVDLRPEQALSAFDNEDPNGNWTLEICDDADQDTGTFNTSTLTITYNAPPTANAGPDKTITTGTSVTLNGSGADTDGTIASYQWKEGATVLGSSASLTKSDFSLGTHTLTLIVTDNGGATASDTVVITVLANQPPVANAGADQTINLGQSVTLDGSSSSDIDGNITDYSWAEGGVNVGTGSSLTLSGLTAGAHTFTLTVTDNDGATASDSVNIRVNEPPVANAGADQNIKLGDTLTLNGSGSTDDHNSLTYSWVESTLPLNLTGATPTANISTGGTYTITLTVTDDNGLTDTDTVTIRVNTPPVVEDMNFTILKDTPVSFELNATDADGDTIVSYPIFTVPAHGSLSGPESNMTYTPDTNFTGTDSFTYKAYDGVDYSNEGTVTIHVYPPSTAVHDDFNTTYMTQLNGNVITNPSGRDLGLNIELIHFTTPANGLLNISSDGDFSYTPKEYFDGNDTFSYTIKDDFNLTSTTTVTILVYPPRSDLSISKTAPAEVDSGLPIDYTLAIHNSTGEQYIPAKNVRVTDYLPTGVIYNGITVPTGWTCGQLGGTVSCDASNIPLGYNGTIVIHAFAPNVLGNSINTATISSDTIDPDLSSNSSSATTKITGPDVDLSIIKTVSSPTVTTTDSFTYTINVQNQGSASTTGVTISDTLDSKLGYISINGHSEWTCSQGSSIVCNYIANGGVFAANSSSASIDIEVRAPSTEANITNTASVNSDTPEENTTDNNSSVDVEIIDGTIQNNNVPLTKYREDILYGDYTFIANANINKPAGDTDQNYNDQINMTFVDTDNDANTFNSSSSTLDINSSYTIKWAGLYWEGQICSKDAAGNDGGAGTGCRWANTPYANFNAATANINNSLGTIQLKVPGGNYRSIRATMINTIPRTSNNPNNYVPAISWTYSAFADITSIIQNAGNGTYSVADIVLTEGKTYGGNYGGWTILVVYEDPSHTLHYKDISIFNGFQYMTSDDNNVTITGFLTPHTGAINASLAFFAADGDPANGGVGQMRVKQTNTYAEVTNVLNPAGNLLNSTISAYGVDFNNVGKTYGVDADRIDVSSFLTNDQTDTQFKFDVTNPSDSTKIDYYSVSMFTFATDLTSPIIDNFSKSAVILDTDGTVRTAGPNEPIYPGSSLKYTITFKNVGDEVAEDVVIFDDFDFDGLSQALAVDHFDTTQLKLFDGNGTSNQIANPDCGYDIADRRVYCNLPTVAINAVYTMQFVVTVKENLDITLFDKNASNTAYAKYRNPNGDNYVEYYTTPSGEAVGGKSNSLNSGVFSKIDRSNQDFISVDAINAEYDYNTDRNITTKIVNKPFSIQLVHRDIHLQKSAYQAYGTKPMLVLVSLEDDGTPTKPLAIGSFTQGTITQVIDGLMLEKAHQNDKLKMAYLDWKTILSWAPSTSACKVNPEQSANLSGLPACFNSYDYVDDIFPIASYPKISECYGKGITIPTGRTYACDPAAYKTGGSLRTNNIYPDGYNHDYGCYQCITQGFLHFRNDSTDNFAARPDKFEFSSNEDAYPDLLRSGQEYKLNLKAIDGSIENPQPTLGYNITTGNTLHAEDVIFDTAIAVPLDGNATIDTSNTRVIDGVSVDTNGNPLDTNGDPIDNIGFTFNNVGKVKIPIVDSAWAWIDEDDGISDDCNVTTNNNGVPIEAGRSICGEIETTFIPHHFKVTASLANHRGGSFTYMHNNDFTAPSAPNEPHMAAHIKVAIVAQNAANETTTNFKKDAYENKIFSDFNVTDWNTTLKFIKDAQTPRLDVGITKKIIKEAVALKLGFGSNGYAAGTYTIETDNTVAYPRRLMFNYARAQNSPKNPFKIDGSEINITIASKYTTNQGAVEGTAIIDGKDIADGNATFYYGRIRPAQTFYPKVTANSKKTPILIDVYCDTLAAGFGGSAQCNTLGIDTIAGEFSESHRKWWLALRHDMSKNDGNITLKIPDTSTGIVNPTDVNITPLSGNAKDANITVSPSDGDRPVTVSVDLDTSAKNKTSEWLIYNPNAASTGIPPAVVTPPSPLEQVEFIGNSAWTGHGETGNVVGSNANKHENRRLGW